MPKAVVQFGDPLQHLWKYLYQQTAEALTPPTSEDSEFAPGEKAKIGQVGANLLMGGERPEEAAAAGFMGLGPAYTPKQAVRTAKEVLEANLAKLNPEALLTKTPMSEVRQTALDSNLREAAALIRNPELMDRFKTFHSYKKLRPVKLEHVDTSIPDEWDISSLQGVFDPYRKRISIFSPTTSGPFGTLTHEAGHAISSKADSELWKVLLNKVEKEYPDLPYLDVRDLTEAFYNTFNEPYAEAMRNTVLPIDRYPLALSNWFESGFEPGERFQNFIAPRTYGMGRSDAERILKGQEPDISIRSFIKLLGESVDKGYVGWR